MTSYTIYHQTAAGLVPVVPDAADPQLYRDLLLTRRLGDVFGHVPAEADGLVMTRGEVFYSTLGVDEAWGVRNLMIGNGDLDNACWAPDPRNAVPEYVGVRFAAPLQATGFQFASNASISDSCPYKAAPCGHPTSFSLQGSNDEETWTPLLAMTDFTGMRVTFTSPYPAENCSWWDDGVFLSDRMDIADPHYFLAYRLVVSAFKPDIYGNYNISELVLYGTF
ncbi:MAG: hypothetical protein ACP59X_20500 [Solidesulfovibrio sp. DCME]|uniref:hypothetical protein n=1 Tax=Solidesulfovibrio sp. DCME TaxID=3447380 RepID=UPI003D0AC8F5